DGLQEVQSNVQEIRQDIKDIRLEIRSLEMRTTGNEKANELGLKSFTIDSDPNAKGYYLKMGAQLIGETPSTVFKGRVLPLLKYDV
ncbi:hypothetical protein ACUN3C_22715, partial [Bacillus cereus group sp. BceL245]